MADDPQSTKPTSYSTSPDVDVFAYEDGINFSPYVAGSDALAKGRGQVIGFMHVPSQTKIYFKAFVTNFNETYNSDWATETVYGRADPIYSFKNTTRKIALSFKVPAASQSEAYENLGRVQKLIQFLYPNYTTLLDPTTCDPDVFAQTISQSPLVRMKIMNIIQDQQEFYRPTPGSGEEANTYEQTVGKLEVTKNQETKKTTRKRTGRIGLDVDAAGGLLGVIDNITVDHQLQSAEGGVFDEGKGVILPKLLEINLAFSPIHEHPVGWREDATADSVDPFFNPAFPYGINLEGSVPVDTTPGSAATTPNENESEGNIEANANDTTTTGNTNLDNTDTTAQVAGDSAAATKTALELGMEACVAARDAGQAESAAAQSRAVAAIQGDTASRQVAD